MYIHIEILVHYLVHVHVHLQAQSQNGSEYYSLLSNLLYLQGDMIRHGFFPRKARLRVPAKSWWPKTKQRKMSMVKSMVEDSGSLQWRWDFRAKAFLKLRALGQGQWVRAEFSSRSAGSKIYTWQFQLVDLSVPRFSKFQIQSMIMIPDGVVEWLCLRAFVSAAKLADGDTAHWRWSAGRFTCIIPKAKRWPAF